MFVDTSVFIAILKKDPESFEFSKKMLKAKNLYTSAIVIYEAIAVRTRDEAGGRDKPFKKHHYEGAKKSVFAIVETFQMKIMAIGGSEANIALEAMSMFGSGSGQGASLGMADCFSYACAKTYRIPLLFKGNDFKKTDITKA